MTTLNAQRNATTPAIYEVDRGDARLHPTRRSAVSVGGRKTYTVEQAAVLLGISRTSAYQCVKTGELPSLRLGRRILVSGGVLDELLAAPQR